MDWIKADDRGSTFPIFILHAFHTDPRLQNRLRLSTVRSDCFRAHVLPPTPAWEVDWLLKFVENDVVVELEESPEDEEEEEDRD